MSGAIQVEAAVVLSDEVINRFIRLMENTRDTQFEIGDMLIAEIDTLGRDKRLVVNHLASRLRVNAGQLYEYYRIAKRWTPYYRNMYQSLDWTIYRNADPIADKELLEQAIDKGWNASTYKQEKYPAMKEPGTVIRKAIASLQKLAQTLVVEEEEAALKEIVESLEKYIVTYVEKKSGRHSIAANMQGENLGAFIELRHNDVETVL